jgi:hypothetical protein
VTVVLVHGLPETAAVWDPLRSVLPVATTELDEFPAPLDLVAHDLGALLVMRLISSSAVTIRSRVVDVAELFHPSAQWAQHIRDLQTAGLGEQILATRRTADPSDPQSTAARLAGAGVPFDLARQIGAAHDETMSRSILDFYRSAVPNVGRDWWTRGIQGRGRGLVLLLPDPPEIEAMALEVAARLGAETQRLGDLPHCWMANAPDRVADVLNPDRQSETAANLSQRGSPWPTRSPS